MWNRPESFDMWNMVMNLMPQGLPFWVVLADEDGDALVDAEGDFGVAAGPGTPGRCRCWG